MEYKGKGDFLPRLVEIILDLFSEKINRHPINFCNDVCFNNDKVTEPPVITNKFQSISVCQTS